MDGLEKEMTWHAKGDALSERTEQLLTYCTPNAFSLWAYCCSCSNCKCSRNIGTWLEAPFGHFCLKRTAPRLHLPIQLFLVLHHILPRPSWSFFGLCPGHISTAIGFWCWVNHGGINPEFTQLIVLSRICDVCWWVHTLDLLYDAKPKCAIICRTQSAKQT